MVHPQLLSELKTLLGEKSVSKRADTISEMVMAKIKTSNEKSFKDLLLEFIDQSGHTDADIYKRASCSRQLFYKIKNQEGYHASKDLVMSFCLALELRKADVDQLLQAAGYALSKSDHRDIAFAFCIDKGLYDIMEVNDVLKAVGKKPLL